MVKVVILLKVHLQDSLSINNDHVHCLYKDLMTNAQKRQTDIPRQIKQLIITSSMKLFSCFRGLNVLQKDLHTKLEFRSKCSAQTVHATGNSETETHANREVSFKILGKLVNVDLSCNIELTRHSLRSSYTCALKISDEPLEIVVNARSIIAKQT